MLLLGGLGLLAIAYGYDEPAVHERIGGNEPVNEGATDPADISAHNSPTLAQNPRDGDVLAVANRIDSPRFSCALHVSDDGGASWRQVPLPVPAGEEPKCYAPDVTFDAAGALFVSFVTLRGQGNEPSAVWITRSDDGGRTLSPPHRALGPLSFQVRLTADPEVPERLYLTWLDVAEVGLYRFTTTGNPVLFTRSDDGGGTWAAPARVSSPDRPRVVAPSLAPGPGGQLFALYLDVGEDALDYAGAHEGRGGPPYGGTWKLVLARSRDGGVSWEEKEVEPALIPTERFIAFIPPYPSLAVDREEGRVYAAYHDGTDGSSDVVLWASEDGGVRFRRTVLARGDSVQRLPEIAVAPDGRLDAVYYDGALGRMGAWLRSSFDGGRTFAAALELSQRPFDARIGYGSERGLPDLGSRLGLVSGNDAALAVWTDTRAGTRASNKQDLAQAVVAIAEPRQIAGPLRLTLLILATALCLAALAMLWRRRRGP